MTSLQVESSRFLLETTLVSLLNQIIGKLFRRVPLGKVYPQMKKTPPPPQPAPLKEGVDYYIEKGYWVFTELFLRKRGYCCGSGCRHCPYRKPAEKT
jgi:hypothetical protein